MPFILFIFVLVAIILICINIFSNMAIAVVIGTIIGPIIINYGVELGINVSCVIPALVMTALCAFITMAAGGLAPPFLGNECIKENSVWIWKYGLLVCLVIIVAVSLGTVVNAYIF